MLETILKEFESVLKKFKSQDFEEIKEHAEEISNAEDVQKIRKQFADFMDYGRASLVKIVNMCLDDVATELRRERTSTKQTIYDEMEVVCLNHSHPRVLAKGLFPAETNPENAHFTKSNLIYSHYTEEIKNGNVICDKCGRPGSIDQVLTTIIIRQDVSDIVIRRDVVDEVSKTYSELFKRQKGRKGTKLSISPNELRQKIFNPIVEKHGFTNLYDALEATRAFSVDLIDIFGPMYGQLLRDPTNRRVPLPIMSITYSEKDNRGLADKYILVKYGENQRDLHDLCRVRFVPYRDKISCAYISGIFKRMAENGIINILPENQEKKKPYSSRYQAIHHSIDPFNTGLVSEVQIRTNEMDTLAETDPELMHRLIGPAREREIQNLLNINRVSEKEVYLIRLILDPASIRSYRNKACKRS